MKSLGTVILRGHALVCEGAGWFEEDGRLWRSSGTEPAFGRCECGERSPVLPSIAARKRWHRQHKDAVRSA